MSSSVVLQWIAINLCKKVIDTCGFQVNYIKDFGLGDEDVGRLLAFKPQLMACGIEERWKPLLKYLYYLGINRDGMRRMLVIKPMVFCVDLETTIVQKVVYYLPPSVILLLSLINQSHMLFQDVW